MKFDSPATTNPIDRLKVVGKPIDRIDGKLKTTGTAPYAYERNDVAPNAAYGYILGASIAKGRITSLDVSAAKRAPGVIAVVTYQNAGKLAKAKAHTARLLAGPEVQHFDQAVAIVVAETFEQARDASRRIKVRYAATKGAYDLAVAIKTAQKPAPNPDAGADKPDTAVGDFAGAFAKASVQLDETYTTPDQCHAMMEPHATTAAWEGDKLTVWTSNQMIAWAVRDLTETLLIPKENVRVISPYIGGGFGSKLWIRADALAAILGARAAGRPVKVALARTQIFNNTTHRPATIQRIRIGCGPDGRIAAIGHESWSGDLPGGGPETAANQTRLLYAGENRMTAHRLAVLDLPEGNAMRAPGEAPGLMALEIAMDELAEKLKIDPVELRIRNDVQYDPEAGPKRPFSHRDLIGCLRTGAQRFGWDKRSATPGRVRDGRWLVGLGMAAAFRNNISMTSAARVGIDRKGVVTVATDMTDIGTGSYTVIAQTAAEMMGVDVEKVVVLLGDSSFPASSGSGGQWGGNSASSGVYAACVKLREALARKAGFDPATAVFDDGKIRSGNKSATLAELAGDAGLSAEDTIEFEGLDKAYAQSTFGAHFVEAGVDAQTGEIRVRRMGGAFAAGRILNPKSARSQVIGAMTMGVGAALMEEAVVDKRYGCFINHDMAGYEVPVHADIPHQDVVFLDEVDDKSSPLKAKGVGELGICGVGAAVANAVYNACGVRVREYPITLDKILAGWAKV
ncbi:MAG: xanthine dehydrogenase family protein molybdopterin-binding subunit [Alphaproteobacteria bacterium]|nr:xanthine dehydrogenase family protein molybdopterin-binding subunit [Alphaproteobacteria bacterium]MBU1513173.1 xanthine dehydrogenase family protein molybdopterin-binding subunit [Alphaproteobacteria bacterium]MBU2095281.1 xanthine dehydrogenase family protein molybdopterin-binding subunit [Alphaproteobacteria bacterium]MBU2152196.1 xanthine dehydrogenase family protein molybdopterin-binding subunit [Alphaproteobacteria bacterium]MBU2306757.1 xanthine dehydrogenase family protein molybdopte